MSVGQILSTLLILIFAIISKLWSDKIKNKQLEEIDAFNNSYTSDDKDKNCLCENNIDKKEK